MAFTRCFAFCVVVPGVFSCIFVAASFFVAIVTEIIAMSGNTDTSAAARTHTDTNFTIPIGVNVGGLIGACVSLFVLMRSSYNHFRGPRVMDWIMSEMWVPGFLTAKDATRDPERSAHNETRFWKEVGVVFGALGVAELLFFLEVFVWYDAQSSSMLVVALRWIALVVGSLLAAFCAGVVVLFLEYHDKAKPNPGKKRGFFTVDKRETNAGTAMCALELFVVGVSHFLLKHVENSKGLYSDHTDALLVRLVWAALLITVAVFGILVLSSSCGSTVPEEYPEGEADEAQRLVPPAPAATPLQTPGGIGEEEAPPAYMP